MHIKEDRRFWEFCRSVKLTKQVDINFFYTALTHKRFIALVCSLGLAATGLWADNDISSDDPSSPGGIIINRYLQATAADSANGSGEMEIDIDASVPKLNQHGSLRVLRMISEVGKITYRVLGFQGDNTVKNQVIARYLQAEQQGQNDSNMKLTPANYKFKLKGQKFGDAVYVFQVSPRSKRVGLFKGELWLDAKTCLPVVEKGRLVKNPSVFFRKVDFERDFAIQNGVSLPAHMSSTIDTRLVGKVNLSVAYSSPVSNNAEDGTNSQATLIPTSF